MRNTSDNLYDILYDKNGVDYGGIEQKSTNGSTEIEIGLFNKITQIIIEL